MTEAIFGFVGVITGAVLTGGMDYLAKRRDERGTMRAIARAIHGALSDLRSECIYCRDNGTWQDVAKPLTLPAAWADNEFVLGRLLTRRQWWDLEIVRSSQFALRMVAMRAPEQPDTEIHLPALADIAVTAIDSALPAIEQLAE